MCVHVRVGGMGPREGEAPRRLILGAKEDGGAFSSSPWGFAASNAKIFQSTHNKINLKIFKTKIKPNYHLLVILGQTSQLVFFVFGRNYFSVPGTPSLQTTIIQPGRQSNHH